MNVTIKVFEDILPKDISPQEHGEKVRKLPTQIYDAGACARLNRIFLSMRAMHGSQ